MNKKKCYFALKKWCILIAVVHVCIRDYIKPLANFREAAFFICAERKTVHSIIGRGR